MRTEAGLAAAGLRHRPVPWVLLALGVALAVAFPVLAAGLRQEATTAAVTAGVESLPGYERTVLANTFRNLAATSAAESDQLAAVDQQVTAGLTDAGVVGVTRALAFKPVAVDSVPTSLVAVDRLGEHVRLTSGRLPTQCRPTRCEVLAVRLPGGAATTLDRAGADLGLVVTGSADLTDQRLIGSGLVAADRALLLGADPASLGGLSTLDLFGRNLAWYGTLDGRAVAAAGVDAYAESLRRLGEAIDLDSPAPLTIAWPQDRVAAAAAGAAAAGDRFTVLGAGAGALQLGFCAVVAAGARRRQLRIAELLARRGGSTAQIVTLAALQAGTAVAFGSVVGLGIALGVVALRAPAAGSSAGAAVLAVLAATWPLVVGLAVAAVALTTAILSRTTGGPSGRWLLGSALALAVAVCALSLGATGPTRSVVLSGAAVVAWILGVGLLVTLVWPGVVRRLRPRRERLTPLSSSRLIAARRPLLPMVTAGFLAATVCLLTFAAGYRQSLAELAEDQAAYAVPLDVTLAASSRVVAPLEALDPTALATAVPAAVVRPVVNAQVTVFGGTPRAESRPLTGIDPAALTQMHRFGAVTGASLSAADLATRLTVPATASGAGTIPAGDHRLRLRADGFDADIVLGLWLSSPSGRQLRVDLAASGPELSAELSAAEPLTVRALEIGESENRGDRRAHATGEGATDQQQTAGTLALGELTLDGRAVGSWAGWGSGGAQLRALDDGRLRVDYRYSGSRIVLSPGFVPLARRDPLPVAVDPSTAATAGVSGRLVLTINQQSVPARIVAVLDRFPGRGDQVLLADRSAVTDLLDQVAPGTAFVSQVWLAAPQADLSALRDWLRSSPAAETTLTFRDEVAEQLRTDPVATRSLLLLALAGAAALALAVVAAATGVRADQAESAPDRRALEVDGVGPAALRRRLWQRSWLVAVVGLPVGVLGGALLTRFGVGLLLPAPGLVPLRPDIAPAVVALVVAVAAVGVLLAAAVPALAAYREDWPSPAELDLP